MLLQVTREKMLYQTAVLFSEVTLLKYVNFELFEFIFLCICFFCLYLLQDQERCFIPQKYFNVYQTSVLNFQMTQNFVQKCQFCANMLKIVLHSLVLMLEIERVLNSLGNSRKDFSRIQSSTACRQRLLPNIC